MEMSNMHEIKSLAQKLSKESIEYKKNILDFLNDKLDDLSNGEVFTRIDLKKLTKSISIQLKKHIEFSKIKEELKGVLDEEIIIALNKFIQNEIQDYFNCSILREKEVGVAKGLVEYIWNNFILRNGISSFDELKAFGIEDDEACSKLCKTVGGFTIALVENRLGNEPIRMYLNGEYGLPDELIDHIVYLYNKDYLILQINNLNDKLQKILSNRCE